jgi:hypothetical protein
MVVRLQEGRDKGKHVSIWVCKVHSKPESPTASKRKVGQADTSAELTA